MPEPSAMLQSTKRFAEIEVEFVRFNQGLTGLGKPDRVAKSRSIFTPNRSQQLFTIC
jgi:hypothetical protein